MNISSPKPSPLSHRQNSLALSFLSLDCHKSLMPISPPKSVSKSFKRGSIFHYPVLSPSALPEDLPPSVTSTPSNKASGFTPNTSRSSSVFRFRNSFKPSFSPQKFNQQQRPRLESQKTLITPRTILSSLGKAQLERSKTKSFSNLDESLISASSERSRSYIRLRSLRRSVKGQEKSINPNENGQKKLSQVIRRRSCYCSDCGGLSNKEKIHMNIVEPCARALDRQSKALLKFLSKNSEDSVGNTPKTSRSSYVSFSRKSTKSLSVFQPNKNSSFKQIQSLAATGRFEGRIIAGPLSRFARMGTGSPRTQTFDDLENEQLVREDTKHLDIRMDGLEAPVEENENGTRESMLEASIDELGKNNKRRVCIPSLELDLPRTIMERKVIQEEEVRRTENREIEEGRQVNKDKELKKFNRQSGRKLRKVQRKEARSDGFTRKDLLEKISQTGDRENSKGRESAKMSIFSLEAYKGDKDSVIQKVYTSKQSPIIQMKNLSRGSPVQGNKEKRLSSQDQIEGLGLNKGGREKMKKHTKIVMKYRKTLPDILAIYQKSNTPKSGNIKRDSLAKTDQNSSKNKLGDMRASWGGVIAFNKENIEIERKAAFKISNWKCKSKTSWPEELNNNVKM